MFREGSRDEVKTAETKWSREAIHSVSGAAQTSDLGAGPGRGSRRCPWSWRFCVWSIREEVAERVWFLFWPIHIRTVLPPSRLWSQLVSSFLTVLALRGLFLLRLCHECMKGDKVGRDVTTQSFTHICLLLWASAVSVRHACCCCQT